MRNVNRPHHHDQHLTPRCYVKSHHAHPQPLAITPLPLSSPPRPVPSPRNRRPKNQRLRNLRHRQLHRPRPQRGTRAQPRTRNGNRALPHTMMRPPRMPSPRPLGRQVRRLRTSSRRLQRLRQTGDGRRAVRRRRWRRSPGVCPGGMLEVGGVGREERKGPVVGLDGALGDGAEFDGAAARWGDLLVVVGEGW